MQLSSGNGICHLVQIPLCRPDKPHRAPRLQALLEDPAVLKLFHFARFDLGVLWHYLGIDCSPVYCTKIAAKMTRTFTDRHGLKDLCKELLGVEISKQQQSFRLGRAAAQRRAAEICRLRRPASPPPEGEVRRDCWRAKAAPNSPGPAYDFLPAPAPSSISSAMTSPDIFAH